MWAGGNRFAPPKESIIEFDSGTFWMVYDATGFYAEYVLCPSRNWARDVKQDHDDQYKDAAWRIAKVKVTRDRGNQ